MKKKLCLEKSAVTDSFEDYRVTQMITPQQQNLVEKKRNLDKNDGQLVLVKCFHGHGGKINCIKVNKKVDKRSGVLG